MGRAESRFLLMSNSSNDPNKAPLGFYKKNRNAGCKRRAMIGAMISFIFIFGPGGLAMMAYVVFFDGFLLTLWPRIYYSVIGAGVGLVLLSIVGILALCMPKRLLPRVVYTIAALGVIGACGVALGIMVEDTKSKNLTEVEETWRTKWEEDVRSGTLCDLQTTLDCRGWDKPCNNTDTTRDSGPSGDEGWATMGELCPVCSSYPSTERTCLDAINEGIDKALPVLGATIALVFIAVLLNIYWSWRVRSLKEEEDEAEMTSAPTNHYL